MVDGAVDTAADDIERGQTSIFWYIVPIPFLVELVLLPVEFLHDELVCR